MCECGHSLTDHAAFDGTGYQYSGCSAHVDEKVDGSPVYCDCREFKEKKP